MLIITRNLHATGLVARETFVINGVVMTREQVLETRPIERSVAHWLVLVDWDMWDSKPYVVVDPYNPNSLLYLTQADYLSLGKICASNDLTFLVVASPVAKRPVPGDPSSPQSPPLSVGFESKWTRASRASWKAFLDLRKKVLKGVPIVKDSTMVSERPDTVAKTVYLWVRELLHYTEVKNPGKFPELLQPLVKQLRVVLQHNGQMAAVKHLKVSLFVLYSFVAGQPLQSTHPLGYPLRLRNGLPACWSAELRNMIRSGNLPVIRVMASLLNIYRAMDAKHPEFSVDTIIQPAVQLEGTPIFEEYQKFCKDIFPAMLEKLSQKKFRFQYESAFGLLLRTAAPNFSGPSSGSTVLDAQAWRNAPRNYPLEWFLMHKDRLMSENLEAQAIEHQWLPDGLPGDTEDINSPYRPVLSIGKILMAVRPSKAFQAKGGPILGRLHTIDEPAGKVRVVAICDYWTQAALKPVHDYLFEILRCIPQDATFDQDGIVQSYYQRGLSPHWSFDLKSATDLIPLALYKELLKHFLLCEGEDGSMGETRTALWASMLTDRDFSLPPKETLDQELIHSSVRYNTGQPMGALSSWASMAFVHHSLVQFAHYRATGKAVWFTDYLVLGDDVDIASLEAVSTAYKEICAAFGIIIGFAKSLHSKQNCFEFANRRFSPDGDISPLSLREELACSTWMERIEFAKRILRRLGKPIEGGTLLRRVVTSPQWTVVSPELSGRRPSSMLKLIEYCLQNPFSSLSETKVTCISSILKWVTKVIPDKDVPLLRNAMVDTLQAGHLGWRLTDSLRNEIQKEIHGLLERNLNKIFLQDGPEGERSPLFSRFAEKTYGQNTPLANTIAGMRNRIPRCPDGLRRHVEASNQFFDSVIGHCRELDFNPYISAPLSPVAWQYFLTCINLQNMKWLRGIFELWERYERVAARLPVEHSTLYYHRIGESGDQFLHDLLEIWVDLRSTPKPLTLDLAKSLSWNFDYNSSRDNLERATAKALGKGWKKPVRTEHIFGPMLELSRVISSFFGVLIPNIPFFAMAKKGKHWHKVLTRSAAYGTSVNLKLHELSIAELYAAKINSSIRKAEKGLANLGCG
nr:MAG: putative RNA-dependent RNA polymerase [Mitoviridae sp.]